jgi:hypothetical protein
MSLVYAEVLKLARRRGLMIWSALLTVGAVLVAEIVLLALHAVNSGGHGPAGGRHNLDNSVFLLAGLGNVAAILIGSTAGTQDVGSGVFRELVVTGRKRSTLFRVRASGALLVFLPLLAAGFALAVGGAFAFAGSSPQPSGADVAHDVAYVLASTVVNVILSVGIAAFASSRVTVGVLIAWNAIVAQILMQFGVLGSARKLIDVAAAEHFSSSINDNNRVAMGGTTAIVVLVLWAVVPLAVGRWWTTRMDA